MPPAASSAERPRTLAFVMDPIEAEDPFASTTIVLMLEAQKRGHTVLYVDPEDLSVRSGRPTALATPVTVQRERGRHVERGEPREFDLDDEVDIVFQRKDPPVDTAYTIATQILAICQRALVLNNPAGILAHNEKLFALHFPDLMPESLVTSRISELTGFMQALGGEMIVKPLDGKGGEGIFHVTDKDRNTSSILEQSTRFESRAVMAQRYLPAVREGDKRILLIDGEVLGAVLRVPAEGESRANLHVGGRAAKAALSEQDQAIVARIGPVLKREGLFFVGIDVIGEKLTEINVTSPTGVQEVNALEGRCLEAEIIDAALAKLAEKGPA